MNEGFNLKHTSSEEGERGPTKTISFQKEKDGEWTTLSFGVSTGEYAKAKKEYEEKRESGEINDLIFLDESRRN